jgi:hypothetical protein
LDLLLNNLKNMSAAEATKSSHMSLGEMAAARTPVGGADHSHVSSGAHTGSGGGQKGMGSGVTGNETIGNFLSEGGSLDNLTKAGGMDNLMSGIGGSLEHDVFSSVFDQGNMSPFGVSHEGFNLSNELTKATLSDATSTVKTTGLEIAGNTGIISKGGQEH